MQTNEYELFDGLALAELVRLRHVTPGELMACAVELAKRRTLQLNFIASECYDDALETARDWPLSGTFGGIPFLLKDSDMAAVRFPASFGSNLFRETSYSRDATLVDRFVKAGLIPFARTTVPELCMGPTTESIKNGGATINPWSPGLSAGGSSGGSAVAVATGTVPLAHGNDGGGSIRIPASCCGIFGLKPSRGRVPMGPFQGEGWAGLSSEGVLSRSVRDTAAALDAVSGYEIGAPYAAPPYAGRYSDAVRESAYRPLKIGVWRQAWNSDIGIAAECLAAVEHTAGLLREIGHEVIDSVPPELDFAGFAKSQALVVATSIAGAVDARLEALGRSLRDDDLELAVRDGYSVGKAVTAVEYGQSVSRFHSAGRMMALAMEDLDIILTPTLTQLPMPLGYLDGNRGYWDFRERLAHYAAFIAICNASGQPAANIPAMRTKLGIPVGVQLIANFGREDLLLSLSAQIERVAPWNQPWVEPATSE